MLGFSKSAPVQPSSLWVYAREGERDAYWPLTHTQDSQVEVSADVHSVQHPWELHAERHHDVISFAKDDDLDLRAQKNESTSALVKREMAEVGTKLVSWRQNLKNSTAKQNKRDVQSTLKQLLSGLLTTPAKATASTLREQTIVDSEWLYASPATRLADVPAHVRIWSGRAILRVMLSNAWQSTPMPSASYVTGVVFAGDKFTVVVFFTASLSGELTNMQYVPIANFDEVAYEDACTNYAQFAKLSASTIEKERIRLFSGTDFVQKIDARTGTLRPYPREPELFGLAESRWLSLSMQVSALGFVGTLAVGAYAWSSAQWHEHDAQVSRQGLVAATQQQRAELLARMGTITQVGSVSMPQASALAQVLFREGMRVEIDADRNTIKLKLVAKVADEANLPQAIAELLNITPPVNCIRLPIESTPQLNEVYLNVQCPSVDSNTVRLLSGNL